MGLDETEGAKFYSTGIRETEEATNTLPDCKKTLGSGCKSAKCLSIIQEDKRAIVDDREVCTLPRDRESLDWYSFCSDGGGCTHVEDIPGDLLAPIDHVGDIVIIHVWVRCPHLGLSLGLGSANMLLGGSNKEI